MPSATSGAKETSCIFYIVLTRLSGPVESQKWLVSPVFKTKIPREQQVQQNPRPRLDSKLQLPPQVLGHHGHPGVVAVSPVVGRVLPPEHVLALLPSLLPVRDQVQIVKDVLAGNVQWMALGLHGHPGAYAASPVVEEQPLEPVPALLRGLVGSPAWERAKKAKIVKLGNAQPHGHPGDLGAGAAVAAVEVGRRGSAHAWVGLQPARG